MGSKNNELKKNEMKPTAVELAAKCGKMIILRDRLSKSLEATNERCYDFEILRIEGKSFDESEYRDIRNSQGDLKSQMAALDRRIEDLKDLGRETLKAEIATSIEQAVVERKALKLEARSEILTKLIPLQAEVIVLQESLTNAIVGQEHEERLLLSRELLRLRSNIDPQQTPIGKIRNLDNLLGSLNRGESQNFNQLVDSYFQAA
jgi:hypothetical protein